MNSPGPTPPHRAPDPLTRKEPDRVPGFLPEQPNWTPENQSLLQRFLEEGLTRGAADAPLAPMPPSRDGHGFLDRTLEKLRDSYLVTRTQRGQLHFEHDLPAAQLPEEPVRALLEHLVESGLGDNSTAQPYCHVGLREADDQTITLYVHDNGPALPECSMDALRRFLRDNRVERIPDRVYRLMLADTLVQWLGGTLWIGPAPGANGTTVYVRLPRQMGNQQRPPRSALVGRHVF